LVSFCLYRPSLFPYTTLFRSNALGVAHARMGAHAEAVEFFAEALCLAPRLTEAKGNLGLSYAAMDRLPESLRSFQMALQDQPSKDRKSTRLNSSHVKISYAVF